MPGVLIHSEACAYPGLVKDVSGLDGKLGNGEEHWPRAGQVAPARVDVPEWPLVDVNDHGPNDGNWIKL
jgi:hypothetical protein